MQRHALLGNLRMERESDPRYRDFIFLLQTINTPGDEIAPGSNGVGEYLEKGIFTHILFSISWIELPTWFVAESFPLFLKSIALFNDLHKRVSGDPVI